MRATRVALVLSLLLAASAAFAASDLRPNERKGWAGSGPAGKPSAPLHAASASVVVVDDGWSALTSGTPVTVGANGYIIGTDAFATIQAGIDAVTPGGTVNVLPGAYSETAAGRFLYDASGPYQFGLFLDQGKAGVTVRGVTATGTPITTWGAVQATVTTNATNDFGPSGVFVEADGATLSGLAIGVNSGGQNKTLEVIGDDFHLVACDVADVYGSVYVSDFRYDAGLNVSHVKAYRIEGCRFQDGVSLDFASGAGYSGPVSGRVITGNEFHNDAASYWPSISFNGSDTGVPWFVWSVGGAQITGNSFADLYPEGQLVRARGTYDNSQFDWASYWNTNTFDRAVVVGPGAPASVRAYSYVSGPYTMNDVRRIGSAIQPEVLHAATGDVVLAKPGTYVEQVVVNGTSLTLQGAGRTQTTVRAPATLTQSYTTSAANFPVVMVTGGAPVTVRDLTVDGAGVGNANYRLQGIGFWNTGGRVLDCDVVRVRDTPFTGNQAGVGIFGGNNAGTCTLEVGGTNVSDFQKGGIVINGAGYTGNVHDCTVTGQGHTALNAQNGIQVSFGATATIANCAVSGIYYTGASYTASGQLLYAAGTVTITGGSVTGCQTGTYFIDTNGSITGGSNSTPVAGGVGAFAVLAYNSQATLLGHSASGRALPKAQPMEEASSGDMHAASLVTVTVNGGCLVGPGTAGTEGIDVSSGGGGVSLTATNLEISGWDWGIWAGGAGVNVNAHDNAITGNLTAGYEGLAGGTHLAANNWWGSNMGPGAGGANGVIGPVTVSPWLLSGVDVQPGCGFTAGPPNAITPQAPVGCITPANPCVAIPVTITRSGSDPMRAFSVDVTLSPNLAVCGASFTGGTYLLGLPNFAWYANGPNTWTVDGASLGLPCGATAPTGLLFTLYVSSTSPSGTGTVTLSNPQLRDCGNVPLAAVAGGAATITIDNTSPAAVTALAAAQVTTGNDANGTTKIQLTFTAPGDAAAVKVYRAPFGQYPEYDDAGGAAPAAPGAYPPAAPWTLTAVTATGQADEPATRDWWYYVAYAQDACGNWSAASNVTGGTLNYHLGDVSDGMVAGQGDNLVAMGDISMLGFHYGITLAPFDTWNFLDVGPTTNNYVNGRPLTDSKVNFEDLMMFALNYGQVSLPSGPQRRVEGDANTLAVRAPSAVTAGSTFDVALVIHGVGDLQGLSARLAWDAAVAAPVSVRAGELLAAANGVAYAPEPGGVDAAVLGTGATIGGDGVLATVTFRANAAGDPRVKLAGVEGRDGANRPLALGAVSAPTPVTTQLAAAQPNPFRGTTTIAWSLARPGVAELAVYSVDGRLVRTLASGAHEAGSYRVHWNGADDQGRALRAGVYFVRMRTAEGVQRRSVVLVP